MRSRASCTWGSSRFSTTAPITFNLCIALLKPSCGPSRISSNPAVSQTAKRQPSNLKLVKSTGRAPSKDANASEASSTERQRGPIVSKRAHSGTTPLKDSRPLVVLSPTKSFQAAGTLTDPPVSDPIAKAANPNATDAAAPEEEPPETAE